MRPTFLAMPSSYSCTSMELQQEKGRGWGTGKGGRERYGGTCLRLGFEVYICICVYVYIYIDDGLGISVGEFFYGLAFYVKGLSSGFEVCGLIV